MLKVKPGVTPANLIIAAAVANVAEELGITATITSGTDGKHMEGSLHYVGKALDIRLVEHEDKFIHQLSAHLGPDYQLILEADHLHVELDPRPHLVV